MTINSGAPHRRARAVTDLAELERHALECETINAEAGIASSDLMALIAVARAALQVHETVMHDEDRDEDDGWPEMVALTEALVPLQEPKP